MSRAELGQGQQTHPGFLWNRLKVFGFSKPLWTPFLLIFKNLAYYSSLFILTDLVRTPA